MKGSVASTPESKKIDKSVRTVSKKLSKSFSGYDIGHRKNKPLFDAIPIACCPDGGIWLDDQKKVVAAFEAKHQGDKGNAIERWCKNSTVLMSQRGEKFRYVTFMSGIGSHTDEVLDKFARAMIQMHNKEGNKDINKVNDDGISFFLSPDGFTDEQIEAVMRKALS